MNRDIDTLIGGLAPVTDARAAELMSDESAADLADRITRTAVEPPAPRRRRSRGLAIGLPLAAGLACAAVAVAAVAQDPAVQPRPNPTATAQGPNVRLASALTIEREGDHIDVRVRDPLADPKRYEKELAAHGLKVELSLVPVSPSIVGTVVMMDTSEGTRERDITAITAKGECETGGGGDACPVGVRVSTAFKGEATVVFGRAARPGEQYNSTAPVTAPGEVMHGMTFRKQRVSQVLAALKKRDVTVPEYRYMDGNVSKAMAPAEVPPAWYVHDAVPWAKNQVLLFVGPEPSE
ncbi:hypothetical protein [Spirillospora sp. NPDC029432]|uniref:hypothetical protein n=1 Tax=Spirillospora sp. NPDC029432 TaxID=3154599 RepID=UPI0034512673